MSNIGYMAAMELTKEGVREIKALHDSRTRSDTGLFLIEGIRLMEEALKEGVGIREVLYTERVAESERGRSLISGLRRSKATMFQVQERVMRSVSETEAPQGILAVARQMEWSMDDAIKGRRPVIFACGLQDPGNLGTIIRTADAADIGGVITTSGTVDTYNSKVVRGSMGSIFRLPVPKVEEFREASSFLKGNGYRVAATSAKAAHSYLELDYGVPTAFIIGQEGAGLPDNVMDCADVKVFIPMKHGVESLNAAAAATILIYETVRQRMKVPSS